MHSYCDRRVYLRDATSGSMLKKKFLYHFYVTQSLAIFLLIHIVYVIIIKIYDCQGS